MVLMLLIFALALLTIAGEVFLEKRLRWETIVVIVLIVLYLMTRIFAYASYRRERKIEKLKHQDASEIAGSKLNNTLYRNNGEGKGTA